MFYLPLKGQDNLHQFFFEKNFSDTIIYAPGLIVPSSVVLCSQYDTIGINAACLEVKKQTVLINQIEQCLEQNKNIVLRFRTLPTQLSDSLNTIKPNGLATKDKQVYIAYDIPKNQQNNRFIQSNNLNYAGSFSRGFSLGNSQDLVLNSNLNLQLQGDLGDGLMIRGTITDDQLPIQAEGNTQVLQEFEQVYIELEKNQTKLVAGDFTQQLSEPYFLKYSKKSKGVRLSTSNDIGKQKNKLDSYASMAISRGKFNRQNLETSEGNQGPYRLEGSAGAGFFVILSGTEKVFRDGILLTRGFENDYIIDYNNASIQFTINCLITNNTRIIVEYEFADQQYLRTVGTVGTSFTSKHWANSVDYYVEQDSKNATGVQNLDSIDLVILSNGGDDPNQLERTSIINIEEEEEGQLYYALRNNILVFPPTEGEDVYEASFSFVGKNQGAYAIDLDINANGRVYTYVGPGLGDFAPVKPLVAPKSNQYLTFRNQYTNDTLVNISSELILNHNDANRFSLIDDQNNTGLSWYGQIDKRFNLTKATKDTSQTKKPIKQWLDAKIYTEIKHQYFQTLNPYRSPEFVRDWAVDENLAAGSEWLGGAILSYQNEKLTQFNYQLDLFNRTSIYQGVKHSFTGRTRGKTTDLEWNVSQTQAEDINKNIGFFRPSFNVKQFLGKRDSSWSIQLSNLTETNVQRNLASDSLVLNSFHFEEYKSVLSFPETESFDINFNYTFRNDFNASDNQIAHSLSSQDYGMDGFWSRQKKINFKWNAIYRNLEVINPILRPETPKKTYIAKLENNLNLLKGGLKLNTFAQYNSGQTAKFEDQYIKVQKGEGVYRWVDINMDSIQQVNEFLEADFIDQGEYIKVAIFNNTFLDTKEEVFNQTLFINPKKIIADTAKFFGHAFFEKMFWTSRYKMTQKFQDNNNQFIWKFQPVTLDTSLIIYQSSTDHFLHFNQGNPDYDVKLGQRKLLNRRTQVFGFEQTDRLEYYQQLRISKKSIDFFVSSSFGTDTRSFQANPERDMKIDFLQIEPKISYIKSTKFRVNFSYKYLSKTNQLSLNYADFLSQGLKAESVWRRSATSSFRASLEYANVSYDGSTDPFISIELLEGLKAGNNYLWQIQASNRLTKVLELNINYNGRKTGESRMIHLGNATIRAIF